MHEIMALSIALLLMVSVVLLALLGTMIPTCLTMLASDEDHARREYSPD